MHRYADLVRVFAYCPLCNSTGTKPELFLILLACLSSPDFVQHRERMAWNELTMTLKGVLKGDCSSPTINHLLHESTGYDDKAINNQLHQQIICLIYNMNAMKYISSYDVTIGVTPIQFILRIYAGPAQLCTICTLFPQCWVKFYCQLLVCFITRFI